jgi:hypothetical protein
MTRGNAVSLKFLPVMIGLGAALGFHDWSPRTPPPFEVSLFARELQSYVGRSFGVMTLRSVQAQDDELVLTLDGAAGWRGGTPSYSITASVLRGFCSKPMAASYFAEGRTIRIDLLEAGANPVRGVPVTRCPQA